MDARKGLMLLLAGACALATVPACGGDAPSMPERAAGIGAMPAFASEAEFEALLARWREQARRQRADRQASVPLLSPGTAAPMPAPAPVAEASTLDSVTVVGTGVEAELITNVQTEGIDEGDIVKAHGDYLVVLRRGRLFTIRIGGDSLQPVSTVPAHGPDVDPSGTWYDEMLLGNGRVVVVGYSYARGGTEIGLFDLDAGGGLHYRATYQLRSNDYYSARNYASRLIGDRLVFYTPLYINAHRLDPEDFMPALRRWRGADQPAAFERILPATRIHRTGAALDLDDGVALHTVNICDLAKTPMRCESTAVLGPPGHVFHVSSDAVYVWTTPWRRGNDRDASSVFRIPLDGGAPGALQASGSPIDQMSFLQRDGFLNVLVGSEADGEGMWAAQGEAGALALLRVPLSAFGDGSRAARRADYRALPGMGSGSHALHNRFIGDWLLYGAGQGWGDAPSPRLAHAVRYAGGAPQRLALGHGVERIDALGRDAVLVGNRDADLHFTSVRLGEAARPASVFVQRDAAQGDDRTHGFFYKPDAGLADAGTIGLPIVRGDDSAAVLYLRNRALRLSRHGALEASGGEHRDDGCVASCVDWYGNARPVFLGGRVFALLGYELVEGVVDARGLRERRRIDFSPSAPVAE